MYLSVKEVAEVLGTTTRTVYLYIRSGRLPAHKLGASYCVRKEDVQQLQRPRVGRAKEQPAAWRKRSNNLVVTTIKVRVRQGQAKALAQKLREIREQQRFFSGASEQKIIQSRDDPDQVLIILAWQKTDMPEEHKRLQEIVRMRNELDPLFEWEEAEMFEGETLLHT